MKFLLKIFKPLIKRRVAKMLQDEDIQAKIVNKINAKINIPKLTEAQEAERLNTLYNLLAETAEDIVGEL